MSYIYYSSTAGIFQVLLKKCLKAALRSGNAAQLVEKVNFTCEAGVCNPFFASAHR